MLKIKILQIIAKLLGLRVHVYQNTSVITTIDVDNVESPNDFTQVTSVPERQIGD